MRKVQKRRTFPWKCLFFQTSAVWANLIAVLKTLVYNQKITFFHSSRLRSSMVTKCCLRLPQLQEALSSSVHCWNYFWFFGFVFHLCLCISLTPNHNQTTCELWAQEFWCKGELFIDFFCSLSLQNEKLFFVSAPLCWDLFYISQDIQVMLL
jgi:hypothetical protein